MSIPRKLFNVRVLHILDLKEANPWSVDGDDGLLWAFLATNLENVDFKACLVRVIDFLRPGSLTEKLSIHLPKIIH